MVSHVLRSQHVRPRCSDFRSAAFPGGRPAASRRRSAATRMSGEHVVPLVEIPRTPERRRGSRCVPTNQQSRSPRCQMHSIPCSGDQGSSPGPIGDRKHQFRRNPVPVVHGDAHHHLEWNVSADRTPVPGPGRSPTASPSCGGVFHTARAFHGTPEVTRSGVGRCPDRRDPLPPQAAPIPGHARGGASLYSFGPIPGAGRFTERSHSTDHPSHSSTRSSTTPVKPHTVTVSGTPATETSNAGDL